MKNKLVAALFSFYAIFLLTGCAEDTAPVQSSEPEPQSEQASGNNSATTTDTDQEPKEESADTDKNDSKATKEDESNKNLSGLKAHFIDVGQADATLIEFEDEGEEYDILIDAGDWNEHNVVNYLNEQGITQLDIIIGTHPHSDHIGQIEKIINQFDVEEVWMSGDIATSQTFEGLIEAIDKHGVGYEEPRAGEEYEVGPLLIQVFNPIESSGDLNNNSISFKAIYHNASFLFTGDVEEEVEMEMVNRGYDLKADVFQMGHHGSNTSNSQMFVNAVSPKIAIYSAGEGNSYGHPHDVALNRVTDIGAELYGTDINGTIIVETDGNEYSVTTNQDGNITPSSSGSTDSKENEIESAPDEESEQATNSSCININKASSEQLQEITHIGPARAEELVKLRPFSSVDDLSRINGIGPSRLKDISSQGIACVGGS